MFKTNAELISAFDIAHHPEYVQLTEFTGSDIGFAVQKAYRSDLSYKPPVKTDGTPDAAALIVIGYNRGGGATTELRVPIFVRVSNYSRFISNHSFYYYGHPDCPTQASVEASERTPTPLVLNFTGVYYYNHFVGGFYDKDNHPISGIDILDNAYAELCATVDDKRRARVEKKLKQQRLYAGWCEKTSEAIEFLMKHVFGRTFKVDDLITKMFKGYSAKDIVVEKRADDMDIFGYKASKSIILLFCLSVMGAYAIYYFHPNALRFFKTVAKNNLLSLCFVIFYIWLIDVILPAGLFRIMRLLFRLKSYIESRPMRFK